MSSSAFPKLPIKRHQVKVWLSDTDLLALQWLTQTTGSTRSGLIRGLVRAHLNDHGIVPPLPADAGLSVPALEGVER
jgi:hypothetical protein